MHLWLLMLNEQDLISLLEQSLLGVLLRDQLIDLQPLLWLYLDACLSPTAMQHLQLLFKLPQLRFAALTKSTMIIEEVLGFTLQLLTLHLWPHHPLHAEDVARSLSLA